MLLQQTKQCIEYTQRFERKLYCVVRRGVKGMISQSKDENNRTFCAPQKTAQNIIYA